MTPLSILSLLVFLIQTCHAGPAVLFSHRLIKGLLNEVPPKDDEVPSERFTEFIHKFTKPCSSDAYFIIHQPGLRMSDLSDRQMFSSLWTFANKASSVATFPAVELKREDLDDIVDYTVAHCYGKLVHFRDGDGEVPKWVDTQVRVIYMELRPLTDNMTESERQEVLRHNDWQVLNALQTMPTPFHSVMYLSVEPSSADDVARGRKLGASVFPEVEFTAQRKLEVDRNTYGAEKRLAELRNRQPQKQRVRKEVAAVQEAEAEYAELFLLTDEQYRAVKQRLVLYGVNCALAFGVYRILRAFFRRIRNTKAGKGGKDGQKGRNGRKTRGDAGEKSGDKEGGNGEVGKDDGKKSEKREKSE